MKYSIASDLFFSGSMALRELSFHYWRSGTYISTDRGGVCTLQEDALGKNESI